MDQRIPVIVGSNLQTVVDHVRISLSGSPDLHITGIAINEVEVRRLVMLCRPTVAILCLNLSPAALRELISTLGTRRVSSLLVSDDIDEENTLDLLRCGLCGIVPVAASAEMLGHSARAVSAGGVWIKRQLISKLIEQIREFSRPSIETQSMFTETITACTSKPTATAAPSESYRRNQFSLTQRELQVVRAITEGMTNKEVAAAFGISRFTVKHHLAKVFDKLGVNTRLELATFAAHHQIGNS